MTAFPPSTHARGGLYYEDFEVGALYRHRLTRTVTQMDQQPLHIDAHF